VRGRHTASVRGRRRAVVALAVVAGVLAWAPASEARPAETIECYEDPGLAEDIMDMVRTVGDWFAGNATEEEGVEHAEEAEFDPTGQPSWLVTEVREHKECALIGRQLVERCPEDTTNYRSRGLIPDDCWGTYPTSAYELTSEGANDIFDFEGYGRIVSGALTTLLFNIATAFVSAALWFIGWAFQFDIGEISGLATRLGDRYQTNLVVPSQFRYTAWFVLIAWAGFTALRGKLSVAASEFLLSILLASLAAVLIQDIASGRGDYVESISARVEEASVAMLLTATGGDPNDVDGAEVATALRPLQRELHEVFVEQPFDYLNWGKPLSGTCATARNNILSVMGGSADPTWETATKASDSWARRYMQRQGCAEEARFNASPSGSRVVGALLNMIVAAILLGFLCLVAFTVAVSKFSIGALFALAPFFAVAAILPGRGRRIAWSWLSTLAQLAFAVVATSTLLSVFVVAAAGVLEATDDRSLFERWLLQLAVIGGVLVGRRRLLNSMNTFANWMQDTLGRTSPTFAGQPMAPSGPAGLDLTQVDAAHAMRAAGRIAGQDMYNRYQERRIMRRRYRVARDLEIYKERRDFGRRRMGYAWGWRRGYPRPRR
jgi:TrbL/VirB6 plasmid conjugal transfer protein